MATYTAGHDGFWSDPATWVSNLIGSYGDLTAWTQFNVTIGSNVLAHPFELSGTTADKIKETNANGFHYVSKAITLTASASLTYVVWIKKAERNFGRLTIMNKDGTSLSSWFNLNTGVVGSKDVGVTSSSIRDDGNGWYRCQMVVPCGTGVNSTVAYISPQTADLETSYQGVTDSGIYAWGATGWEGTAAYPGSAANGDLVNIGFRVIFDVVLSYYLGNNTTHSAGITVNGTTAHLDWSRTMTTKLILGNLNYIICQGYGRIEIGTDASPIPSQYLAEIYCSASATVGVYNYTFFVNTNGNIKLVGDPQYYGGVWSTYLAVQANSGDTSIKVPIDVSTKWKSGQQLVVQRGGNYGFGATGTGDACYVKITGTPTWDGQYSTIPVTALTGTNVPYIVGGYVGNTSRNVRVGMLSVNTYPFNWATPAIACGGWNNVPATSTTAISKYVEYVSVQNPLSTAMHPVGNSFSISTGSICYAYHNIYLEDCLITQYTYMWNQSLAGVFDATSVAVGGLINGNFISTGSAGVVKGTVIGVGRLCNFASNTKFKNARIFSCQNWTAHQVGNVIFEDCIFGENLAGGTALNNRDIDFWQENETKTVMRRCTFKNVIPLITRNAILNSPDASNTQMTGKVCLDGFNSDPTAIKKYVYAGEVVLEPTIIRPGGALTSVDLAPGSFLDSVRYLDAFGEWEEDNVPATQQTRSIWAYATGWVGGFPTNAEFYFEVEYYNQLTGLSTTTSTSTAVFITSEVWTEFPVTFTPARKGRVRYKVYLKKYTSASKIYIDNALYRAGMVPLFATWSEGESYLHGQYIPSHPFNPLNGSTFIKRL